MDYNLIFDGKATVEDILTLYNFGYRFDINDGNITHISVERGER